MVGIARLLDRALGRVLLDPEDPTALGLVRIAVVAVLTLSLLTHVGSFAFYFSELSPLHGEYARMAFPSRFSLFFYVENALAVQAIFVVGIVAHVLWMVGRWTTPASIVAWVVWISMVGRNPLLYSLPDQLQMAMATWLVCMPSGRGLSLDARRRGPKPVPVWCRRIIIVQLAAMYTSTGLLKHGKTWHEAGTALYYALSNPYNRHFDVPELLAALQPWVLRPMTWLVLAFEIGFAAFVLVHALRELLGRPRYVPDLRPIVLGFGVLMHLGIQSMMYVAWFSPLVIATYLAFLRPDEARRLVDWITARRRRRPR
jgi:hypothetical protein